MGPLSLGLVGIVFSATQDFLKSRVIASAGKSTSKWRVGEYHKRIERQGKELAQGLIEEKKSLGWTKEEIVSMFEFGLNTAKCELESDSEDEIELPTVGNA